MSSCEKSDILTEIDNLLKQNWTKRMEIEAIYKEVYLQNYLKINKKRLSKIEFPNNMNHRTVYNKASPVIWVFFAIWQSFTIFDIDYGFETRVLSFPNILVSSNR